jgi:protein-L-isoaspartate(D-aspartate) O-methyltransferase
MANKAAVQQMLRTIERECLYTSGWTGIQKFQARVMAAMAEVAREKFVPADLIPYAYDNNPLPIGNNQTISQPYIVALMTDLLHPEENDVILEVGAGSGYQAAVLAKLVRQVYTIEIIPALVQQAQKRLNTLGFKNVEVREGDGYDGLPQHAPFDGIIVTAAASHVPFPLIEQLKVGGRLVIPVGPPHGLQSLKLIEKDNNGEITSREILAVSFVPLTGVGHG